MIKQEILTAVSDGNIVYWKNRYYFIKKVRDDYYVKSTGGHLMGMIGTDGVWNINPDDCFYEKKIENSSK